MLHRDVSPDVPDEGDVSPDRPSVGPDSMPPGMGPQGDTGMTGLPGSSGMPGDTGAQGDTGTPGYTRMTPWSTHLDYGDFMTEETIIQLLPSVSWYAFLQDPEDETEVFTLPVIAFGLRVDGIIIPLCMWPTGEVEDPKDLDNFLRLEYLATIPEASA